MRKNIVPAREFFLSLLANENPAFGINSLPLVATSFEEATRLWVAQKPAIESLLAKQNLKPLFSVPWPPQGLYTKKEIIQVSDLNGLKFRFYNANLEKLGRIFSATGKPARHQKPKPL